MTTVFLILTVLRTTVDLRRISPLAENFVYCTLELGLSKLVQLIIFDDVADLGVYSRLFFLLDERLPWRRVPSGHITYSCYIFTTATEPEKITWTFIKKSLESHMFCYLICPSSATWMNFEQMHM